MSRYRTIALFGKQGSAPVAEALIALYDDLARRGITVLVDDALGPIPALAPACADIAAIRSQAEVAIVVGGDGTLLSAARKLGEASVPLVGINQGRLGFMTDIARAQMLPAIERLLAGEFTPDRRLRLTVRVLREGREVFRTLALNEVVVNKGDLGRMIELKLRVDGEFLYVLRADGMIVATPSGSTAYALSANGPILQPAVPGIALVPLCAHGLTYRPITIADSCAVELELVHSYDGRVHCDGQNFFDAQAGDRVSIERSPYPLTLLHPPGYSYFAMLREKLHWSATPHR
ncbi:NAD(+)/NADH kinase [Sulfuricystis multivorans]|uniref:NAD(+)/NADH kinase n=1 Tax=Sulfuricystis multivorans TaxID=2211108 RepID=UPI000F8328C5|nr:NAD(+)/NADH kinase [Sulfuricystis multivorans]